jgi:hypothetical protein
MGEIANNEWKNSSWQDWLNPVTWCLVQQVVKFGFNGIPRVVENVPNTGTSF